MAGPLPPHLLTVTWLYVPTPTSGLAPVKCGCASPPGQAGGTELELIHAAFVGEPLFATYGPGAGGVGWDLLLLGLTRLLVDGETADHEAIEKSPEGREFIRRSAAAWHPPRACRGCR